MLIRTVSILAIVCVLVLWIWIYDSGVGFELAAVKQELLAWKNHAAAVSILGMIVHSFLPIPAELLAVANGFVFGFAYGTILTWAGAMLGAILSFLLARRARPVLVIGLRNREKVAAALAAPIPATAQLLVRFLPIISFNLINYVAGAANVRFSTFLWTTALGILPVSAISAAVGSEMLDDASLSVWVPIAGLACIVGGGIAARKALFKTDLWNALRRG